MPPFRKPSLADIYVHELKTRLDRTLIPLFTPDTNIAIGTVGRFEKGRFSPRRPLPVSVLTSLQTTTSNSADWVFSSEGSVQLTPKATVTTPLGQQLLAATLSITKNRSVVASFAGMTETRVVSQDVLDMTLWGLYKDGELNPNDLVVWYRRGASSGTVVVARKGNVGIDITADAALLGGMVTLQGLGLGVNLGGGSQADFQMSGNNLTAFLKVKGLGRRSTTIEEIRGFEPDGGDGIEELSGVPVPELTNDEVLEGVDFSIPED